MARKQGRIVAEAAKAFGELQVVLRRSAGCEIPVVVWDHCPERVNGREMGPSYGTFESADRLRSPSHSIKPLVSKASS